MSASPSRAGRLLAFGRLIKPRSQVASLCTLVSMSLACERYREPRYWGVMLAFLGLNFFGGSLIVVLDDIMGYRDGSDRQDVVVSHKRNISKPLLTGDLSVADARRAAAVLVVLAVLLIVALVLMAKRPGLAVFWLAALVGLAPQYSFGLKLSYRGLGEALIAAAAFGCVVLPYWILEGEVTARVILTGALVGIPYAAHLVVANVIDLASDTAAGRRTVPALVGVPATPWVAGVLFLLFWVLYAVALARGIFPATALLWLPLLPSHARFVWLAARGEPARARLLSFTNFYLVIALFSVAYVLAATPLRKLTLA